MTSLDKLLAKAFNEENIAGMSVSVTDARGILYSRAFGVDNIERPDVCAHVDSMYRIASVTKMFTGATVMRLAEMGALSLDEPVRTYLDWLSLKDPEATRGVTLRQLLSHTAGLPAEYTPIGPREESSILTTLMEALPTLEPVHPFGTGEYLYSNWGIRLASAVVTSVLGIPFSEAVEKYVLSPLGMNRTTFDLRLAATYPLSLPHDRLEDGSLTVHHYINENAARIGTGGLYSSAPELCRFARFLLRDGVSDSGERVLSELSLLEMQRSHTPKKDTGDHYGLTVMLHNTPLGTLYGHTGSAPPYSSSLFISKEKGLGVATLINTPTNGLSKQIPELILSEFM